MEPYRVFNNSRLITMDPMFRGTVHTASLAVCTVLVIFVLLLGSFGNGIVILSALRGKKLRSNFDLLIINLAGTDFILCTCLSPVFLYLLFTDPPTPKVFCGSFLFLGTACGMLSLLTIVAIAIHRQARVIGQAKGTLSPTQVALILGVVWVLSLSTALGGTIHVTANWEENFHNCQVIINSPNLKTQNFILFFINPVVLIGFAIITISYSIIARAVRTQSKVRVTNPTTNIYRGPRPKPPDKHFLSVPKDTKMKRTYVGKHCPCCSGQAVLDKENKAVTMCLVVILTIVLCWSPLVVSQFIELLTGESIILYQVKLCGISLVFLNSALDPYIYAQHNGRMKQKYSRLFWDFIRCERRGPKRTRLKASLPGNVGTYKQRTNSQVDQETHTLNLASPKQPKKFVDRSVGPGNRLGQRAYTSNILLFQTTHAPIDMAPCGLPLRKANQIGDVHSVMHDVKSFVHKSCCHSGTPEDQRLIES